MNYNDIIVKCFFYFYSLIYFLFSIFIASAIVVEISRGKNYIKKIKADKK